jgi:tRNA 2-selenouridine synthase
MICFKELFCNNIPMLDLRAPIEFTKGAFPKTTNIPLLTDDERKLVGTCYKQQGQEKAIELGHQIVQGETKSQRLQAWKNFVLENPKAYLYCFRGGMRSHLVQQWLQQEGIDIPLIEGGYKALRSYLIDVFELPLNLMLISGQTGVGKTDLLQKIKYSIDLEGLANHRGSAFGKCVTNQPSQIDFENNLAIDILKQQDSNHPIILEDEGRYIGSVNLPPSFVQNMQNSSVLILTCPQEERVHRIYQDYVVSLKSAFIAIDSKEGSENFDNYLTCALQKIQKRLGGSLFKQIDNTMQLGLKHESEEHHKKWITELLKDYYDPMYKYQLEKKSEKVIFKGDKDGLQEFINDKYSD